MEDALYIIIVGIVAACQLRDRADPEIIRNR